jgi:type I restriction enzyme R subunit
MPRITHNYISEDQIEKACVKFLVNNFGYQELDCTTANNSDMNDGSNRSDLRDVILKDRLFAKIQQLNPTVPDDTITHAIDGLMDRRTSQSLLQANQEIYSAIRDGFIVSYKDAQGKQHTNVPLKLIDYQNPHNNEFLAVTQLSIKTTGNTPQCTYRRPDLLVYINGLPIVFFELKNAIIPLKTAFKDNLTAYKAEIPQLFLSNVICVLSNGVQTRLGSMTAKWEKFYPWLRVDDEKETVDKNDIAENGNSIKYLLEGLFEPARLVDYIENFVLYQDNKAKIIAQNHQFLGVNHAYQNFLRRKELDGKLGVFWHTQGSGKSFSMVFFIRKVLRKAQGNFSFVVITDREDLDKQISKNFLATGTATKAEIGQPTSSEQMRQLLGQNIKLVFTLIQKFRYDKGSQYPLLYKPDEREIIVIVDEAHRTQYKDLAENMRLGLAGAHYIAFTGTPLLKKEKTKQWFGEYVSEYTFKQAIEDGATLPLFYEKRVPTVLVQNEDLNDELAEILEDEELTEAQEEKLKAKFSKELEVVKREDRLDTIAKDIVYHFPRRGYRGKGIVVCIDQFTTVKMYEKVKAQWDKEIRQLQGEVYKIQDIDQKQQLKSLIKYMEGVEMAVVISNPAGEREKFDTQGLSIQPHIDRLSQLDKNGKDIEENFKDPEHPLQLVFVCAMWLTGFDAPTASTLYLDKPMTGHTLMQTIARVNRVSSQYSINDKGEKVNKTNGEIIDYYNVFRNLKMALKDYGQGENLGETTGGNDSPVQEKSVLFTLLDSAIAETLDFCKEQNIDLSQIQTSEDRFRDIELFKNYADILLAKDLLRKTFNVHFNTVANLYEACKPEILDSNKYQHSKELVAILQYLHNFTANQSEVEDLEPIIRTIGNLLDRSVVTNPDDANEPTGYSNSLIESKMIDLSDIDLEKLKDKFKVAEHKNIEINDMRAFIQRKIQRMLKTNQSRVNFADKYKEIVDNYNSGATATEEFFEDLRKFAQDLQEEDKRHLREGLTEDELEIFDLLVKEQLTKDEEKQVKLASKDLIAKLLNASPRVLVNEWWRDPQTKARVKSLIEDVLDSDLPESYDRVAFNRKVSDIFDLVQKLAMNEEKWAKVV